MLEDDFTYVLRKALMGHGLAPGEVASRAGVREVEVLAFLRGKFSAEIARTIAPVLGLKAEAFACHDGYHPEPLAISNVTRLDLPFDGGRVNAWLIRESGACVLFDAGYEAKELRSAVKANCGRPPERVFITHSHRDHVGAVDDFLKAGIPVHGAKINGALPMKPGDTVICGQLAVKACDLSGHAVPSLGFLVDGLEEPVLVTGDALFAGSMGGCGSPELYRHALQRLKEELATLPDATVLLPGHGPATTLGEERVGNPFL
jgi:glyoxylase-like metal-dependent hydrolase (beta-lactamase superfamily II)